MMNEYENMMSEGYYNALYGKLEDINFQYDLEEFTKIFKRVSSEKKYAYLTYVIAKSETPDLHISTEMAFKACFRNFPK